MPNFIYFLMLSRSLHLATYFMSTPFLVIYLKNIVNLTPTESGLVVGISSLIFAIFGIWFKHLSDSINNKLLLVLSYALWSIAYLGYYFSDDFYFFLISSVISGISMCLSSVDRIIIVNTTENRLYFIQKIMKPLYFLGMGLGPVIGGWLYSIDKKLIFITVFILFVFIMLITLFFIPKNSTNTVDKKENKFFEGMKSCILDKRLMFFTVASILLVTAASSDNLLHPIFFSMVDSTYNHVKIISFYFLCNAIFSALIVFVFYLKHWHFSLRNEYLLGCLLYAIGTAVYFLSLSYFSIIIITFIIALSDYFTSNKMTFIKKYAPEEKVGIYSGFLSLFDLGWFLCPLILGKILSLNSQLYLVSIILLVLSAIPLFRTALK